MERDLIMRKLNDVDLRIAATPSKSVADLSAKLKRFYVFEYPIFGPVSEDSSDKRSASNRSMTKSGW